MKKIMRRPEVLAATGLCYTNIFNKMKRNEFPLSRKLGSRAVGWIKEEVDAWIDNLQCSGTAQA